MARPLHSNPLDYTRTPIIGSDYSDEEREFLIAVDQYKRAKKRPFPTWREVLALVHELGYRKAGAGYPEPNPEHILKAATTTGSNKKWKEPCRACGDEGFQCFECPNCGR